MPRDTANPPSAPSSPPAAIPKPAGAARPWLQVANVAMAAILGLVILAEVNYLNNRHYLRFDLTSNRRYSISPKSIQIVRSLEFPIRVETSFTMGQDIHVMARDLLTEYAEYSDQFILGENKNFIQDPTGLEEFAARYKISSFEEALDKVVLEYRGGERLRIVKLEEMMKYGRVNPSTGQPSASTFQGEEKITSAILDLTESRKTGVYFTVGHGELDIRTLSAPGLSKWRSLLDLENYKVDTIDLLSEEELPEDCDVIVIVRAEDPFRPEEEEVLKKYLDGGGHLLLLVGFRDRPGLESILSDWGIDLRNDVVCLLQARATEIVISEYLPHPITNPLRGQRITPYQARSVSLLEPLPDGVEGTVLFESTAEAWGETRWQRQARVKEDSDDHEGPVPMAVALERNDDKKARVAVVGSAFFVMNSRSFLGIPVAQIEEGANDDLALNLIGWLTARERVVGVAGKKIGIPKVRVLEKGDRITIYLFCLAILPGICLVAGLAVWWVRRG
ncbi:MAG: GldG family protein [Planctomycetota bacterium]|nr:GldG family protein [Planctomycetota bacterium]